MAIKFVLVEIVLVETVLVGDPLYNELEVKEQIGLRIFNLDYPGLKRMAFLTLHKLLSRKPVATLKI